MKKLYNYIRNGKMPRNKWYEFLIKWVIYISPNKINCDKVGRYL
jgi:hypothetical protein